MSFLSSGREAQDRYERLRAYLLTEPVTRPRISPAQFDLRRFQRYGMLGLVTQGVVHAAGSALEAGIVALEMEEGDDRLKRLCDMLGGLLAGPRGGQGDATSGAVRPSVDGASGEGTDDPEPARRSHAGG